MAAVEDDLDNFFAKKKSKNKKSKGVQDVDVLAKKLEQTVKQQEEQDREEEKLRQKEMEMQTTKSEDPDWLDPVVPDEVDLFKLKIKEMEPVVEEVYVVEVKEEQESHRTWNSVQQTTDEAATTEPEPAKSLVYIPRQRLVAAQSSKTPDVKNEMEFPSLAAAAELETILDKTKKPFAWGSADKQRKPPSEVESNKQEPAKTPLMEKNSVNEINASTEPQVKKYVPPALRNKS